MNCKQGDLAVVVRSYAGNEGRVVTCVKLYPAGAFQIPERFGPIWDIGEAVPRIDLITGKLFPSKLKGMPDSFLRPLRGDLSEDDADLFVSSPAPKVEA